MKRSPAFVLIPALIPLLSICIATDYVGTIGAQGFSWLAVERFPLYGLLSLALVSSPLPATRRAALYFLGAASIYYVVLVWTAWAPWQVIPWWWHYAEDPRYKTTWNIALAIVTGPTIVSTLTTMAVRASQTRAGNGKSDLHGSAHWGELADLESSGLLNNNGVYVGGYEHKGRVLYLRHDGPQNVLAVAPGRSGKGVGLVIPTLLSWPHSVVVYDIKGENWALTAGWRKQELGSHCIKFDPTSRDGSSAKFNPLFEVRPSPLDIADTQNIAEMLTNPSGLDDTRTTEESHWKLTAQDLLVGIILHVLYAEENKTLAGCLALLSDPGQAVENTLSDMLAAEHDPTGRYGWTDAITGKPTKTHPGVAGAVRTVKNKAENERSGVISTAVKFLQLYRDPIVARNTSACDFAIRDLMQADKPVSLYLTTPPSDIDRTRPLTRLMLNQIAKRLTEEMHFKDGRAVEGKKHRLLLMLDEFPQLGRIEFFHSALSYMPGYGIKAYLVAQDLSQIQHLYGRNESITSNCAVRIAYTPNKPETARTLSDMCGAQTVTRQTRTLTGSRFNLWLNHIIAGEQEHQRALLTPDEVMRLPQDEALVFAAGAPVIRGKKIFFYKDPTFSARAAIPAPTRSDVISAAPSWAASLQSGAII